MVYNETNLFRISHTSFGVYMETIYSAPESNNLKLTNAVINLTSSIALQFKPQEDLAKAAAEELNASGLFKEVFFTQRSSEGELILRGMIKSTRYWGKMLSYGLSVCGPVLWLIGLPVGTVHNELVIDLTLEEQRTGESLWSKTYTMAYHKSPFWLYKMPRDFAYDNLFKDIMQECIRSLESELPKI